jgi:serine/threonine-protein kinase HipA
LKLAVYVGGRDVARLEQSGDFKSVLTYLPDVDPGDLVSLTMPVRGESWVWDDPLHPFFQMNLPEGYLLKVLQEQFGPHVGGDSAALLAVVGRNMIGRVQVAAPGADLNQPARPFELDEVLHGDNSERAFEQLVHRFATSGVSGVVPKFLDEQNKVTVVTHQHIIKGSSAALPYVALNEHLCMEVTRKLMPAAATRVSDDGRALVVDRFDVAGEGLPHFGMEDFCALLGMRPANKYETTWERIAKAVRTYVAGAAQRETFFRLTQLLLLTYALRNSDCHSKNLALLYTSRSDARLAPAYDMLTTTVYADYQDRPPGIMLLGKKTWAPGKGLERFVTSTFGIEAREQKQIVEEISDAVSAVAPQVRAAMNRHPSFDELGKRLLMTWHEGVAALRSGGIYGLASWKPGRAFELDRPSKRKAKQRVVGESPLLGRRRRR